MHTMLASSTNEQEPLCVWPQVRTVVPPSLPHMRSTVMQLQQRTKTRKRALTKADINAYDLPIAYIAPSAPPARKAATTTAATTADTPGVPAAAPTTVKPGLKAVHVQMESSDPSKRSSRADPPAARGAGSGRRVPIRCARKP